MRYFAGVAVVLVLAPLSPADILPPGSKWVSHNARFENLKDFPDYVFYMGPCHTDFERAYPRVGDNGEVGLGGNPIAFGRGQFLFAVPKAVHGDLNRQPDKAWFEGKVEGVLKSEGLVRPIRSAPQSERRDHFLTRYSVAIADGKLTTTQLADEPAPAGSASASTATTSDGESSAGDEGESRRWMVAGGLGLAGLLAVAGLVLVRGRR
jgi:hypothetical protein